MGERELSAIELLNVLLARRKMLLGLPILLAVTVGALNLLRPRTYTSDASFITAGSSDLPLSLGGVTAQLGLSLPSQSPDESPAFYIDLLQSRELLTAAATSEYRAVDEGESGRRDLVDILDIEGDSREARVDAAVRELRSAVGVDQSRESGLLQLTVTAQDAALARQINARLLELLASFNLERRQSQAAAERTFLEERVASVEGELRAAERRLQEFLRQNRQYENSPELMFEHQRLQWEVSTRQQLLTSMAQAYEQARVDEVRNTPLITVVDNPSLPVRPNGRGTVVLSLLVLFGSFAVLYVVAFFLEAPRLADERDQRAIAEFHRLRRETADDVKGVVAHVRPGRAIGGGDG